MTKGGIAARCCFNKSLVPRDDFISVFLTTGTSIPATAQLEIGYSVLEIGYSVMDSVIASPCALFRPINLHEYGDKHV